MEGVLNIDLNSSNNKEWLRIIFLLTVECQLIFFHICYGNPLPRNTLYVHVIAILLTLHYKNCIYFSMYTWEQ